MQQRKTNNNKKILVSFVVTNPGPHLGETLQFLTRQLLLW